MPDTPFQSTASRGCPVGKDSCPSSPGKDSVRNYMDYSADVCMTGFSKDQVKRMREFVTGFKSGLLPLSLTANHVRLELQGRGACPGPRYLSAATACGNTKVTLGALGKASNRYVRWAVRGSEWGRPAAITNVGRGLAGCSTPDLAPTGSSVADIPDGTKHWRVEWLGAPGGRGGLARIAFKAKPGYYLGVPSACSSAATPRLVSAKTKGYVTTWRATFVNAPNGVAREM